MTHPVKRGRSKTEFIINDIVECLDIAVCDTSEESASSIFRGNNADAYDDLHALDTSDQLLIGEEPHKSVHGKKPRTSLRDPRPHFVFADSTGPPGFLALTEMYFQCSWPTKPPTPAMVLIKNRSSLRNLTMKYGTIAIQ